MTSSKTTIPNVHKHILGNNNTLVLKYKSFERVDEWYVLKIAAQPALSPEEHINMFTKWKSRIIKFVRHKDCVNKYGVLLSSLNNKWFCELWFPGQIAPARCFMFHQWQQESLLYDDITISDDEWNHTTNIACNKLLRTLHKYDYKLTFAVTNAIKHWDYSCRKLIKIHNTGISSNFVGLLMRQEKIR
jgi:hypothetical protein